MEEYRAVSGPSTDEVLNKLSTKFNRIFYDREFVCCVSEDFQVILKNKNKCCVVVFPVLGPSYLKAVRYQAKIFDLAVFTLGTGKARFIAVCQKEFLKRKSSEVVEVTPEQIMPESASESTGSKLRKKRPERQLYIPPAQRRLPLREDPQKNEQKYPCSKNKVLLNKKKENFEISVDQRLPEIDDIDINIHNNLPSERQEAELIEENDIEFIRNEQNEHTYYIPAISSFCILWKYRVSKCNSASSFQYFYEYINYLYFKYYHYFSFYYKVPLYSCEPSSNILYILSKDYALWQPKLNIIYQKSDNTSANNSRTYPLYDFKELSFTPVDVLERRLPLTWSYRFQIPRSYDNSHFRTFKVLWDECRCSFSETDVVIDFSVINSGHTFVITKNGCVYLYSCEEDHDILECYLNKKRLKEHPDNYVEHCEEVDQNGTEIIKTGVIVLDERFSCEEKNETAVQKNNIKNTTPNDVKSTNGKCKIIPSPKKSNEHEQEKEIMRKTKEHINRKTRPIIKYVDDANNTLNIEKSDDVNNWEDLFDDNGQLQEELFKEITHKVGSDVTIVKAKEDYSDYSEYVTKPSEELEHMVELYDFPSTLGTHDIIQAFSDINSDAMYVKWVDDTHAILVLGTLKQAQRAVELDNPLIKARPMTAASGMSLAAAYKHDLKPAMKRPQTNLQTARRLITTHLGTKSKISREQTTKERNDLKAAREMKKLLRKNEQDAWEGNLKSSAS